MKFALTLSTFIVLGATLPFAQGDPTTVEQPPGVTDAEMADAQSCLIWSSAGRLTCIDGNNETMFEMKYFLEDTNLKGVQRGVAFLKFIQRAKSFGFEGNHDGGVLTKVPPIAAKPPSS